MSIKSDLKKDGIEVIEKLDTLKVNSIAMNVAKKICATFPNYGFNQNELFSKLSRLDMFKAKMPEGFAEANYFYKNSSIYFNINAKEEDIEQSAIHECIHYIQEVKDNKNYLIKMGLCDYTEFKTYGLGLNEAAVQLMASKINGTPMDSVKYFGISFNTISPSYYPLECCLVNQLAYITGEDVLFESTINSNNHFKNLLCHLISEPTFYAIQNAFDDILKAEEELCTLSNKIAEIDNRNQKVDGMIKKIDELKHKILLTFLRTQNSIISGYFNSEFEKIYSVEAGENFRKKLYSFRDYLGFADGYTFFNDFYINKMEALEERYHALENGTEELALRVISKKENKLVAFFKALKKLIFGTSNQTESVKD